MCKEFEKLMKDEFQMSSMGELNFFLGLQVQQRTDGIFISQDKYVTEILRKFHFTNAKRSSTPADKTTHLLLKDDNGEAVDVHTYRSMIGSLMYHFIKTRHYVYCMCLCKVSGLPQDITFDCCEENFQIFKGIS
jgi:hypothetical protein